jgi:putative nucleotidyltransferase with HDIG domain
VPAGFLTTKVGRRFLVVNLLTAFVPVVLVIAVSFHVVRGELQRQADARVVRLGRTLGQSTLSYLTSITLALRDTPASATDGAQFDAIAVVDVHDTLPTRLRTDARAPLSATELTHLAAGKPVLRLTAAGTGQRVLLARALQPWSAESRRVQWARIRTDALFSELDESVEAEDAVSCLFDTERLAIIHCSDSVSSPSRDAMIRRAHAGGIDKDARQSDTDFISARDIFLRHEYAAAEWRTVVLQPTSASFASADRFRSTFIALAIAVLALIFAVSHAQIRRTTDPLARLSDGTRRLEAGDFGTPVLVPGDDEYAQLASSFNGMAGALQRQLTLMHSLDAVDRGALSAQSSDAVITEALPTFARALPAMRVAIATVRNGDAAMLDVVSMDIMTGAQHAEALRIHDADRRNLLANDRHLRVGASDSNHPWLPQCFAAAHAGIVALPMVHDHVLLGVVIIAPIPADPSAGQLAEARRIADRVGMALNTVQLVARLDALQAGTVLAFARAIDANSPWTAGHSERVTDVAGVIGRELGLTGAEHDTLRRGGLLHDIGKIAVPPAILDKSRQLSEDEWRVMRRHPAVGCEILAPIAAFADALAIVRSHHERMDGTGYPDALYGEEIPWLARILAVADVFDALVSDRPYRSGLTVAAACEIIQNSSGTHFDPRVVHAFMDAVHAGRIIAAATAQGSVSLAETVARARDVVSPREPATA